MSEQTTMPGAPHAGTPEPAVSRREAIRRGAGAGGRLAAGLALGSVPVALATLATEAGAQTTADVLDALRFAFVLENLENEFYKAVLGTSAVAAQNAAFATVRAALPASVVPVLQQIQKHEAQHVAFLAAAIPTFGGTVAAITAADFDFTGGNGAGNGPFAAATADVDFLLFTAQVLEDVGVRAYKGQAGRLMMAGDPAADAALESAVRIHSTEARHASKLRRLRRQRHTSETRLRYSGYVTGGGPASAGTISVPNAPAAVFDLLELAYGGGSGPVSLPENNTTHVFFNGTTAVRIDAALVAGAALGTGSSDSVLIATQAFDEALTKEEVLAIVAPFIRDDPARGLP